jgi:Icc-related predicted phosphoesterase
MSTLKIFFTSDIHGNQNILSKIKIVLVPQYKPDYIIFCGDICQKVFDVDLFELQKRQEQFLTKTLYPFISDLENKTGVKSYFIFGNDDWVRDEKYKYHFKFCDLSMPWFELIPFTPFNTNREANNNKLKFEINNLHLAKNDILITHAPPFETRDKVISGENVGSKPLKNIMKKAQLQAIMCGHIHEDFGDWKNSSGVQVFNCACDHQENDLRGYILELEDGIIKDVSKIRK